MDLDGIKTLSFDCYGTLIDWETGLLEVLGPWLKKNNKNPPDEQVLEIFGELEFEVEEASPDALYPEILEKVHQALGEHFNIPSTPAEQKAFGASVKDWPAFSDSAEARFYIMTVTPVFKLGGRGPGNVAPELPAFIRRIYLAPENFQ